MDFKAIVTKYFDAEENLQIRMAFLDCCFILDGYVKIQEGKLSTQHATDLISLALYSGYNNPFLASFQGQFRALMLDAMNERNPIPHFIERAIPTVVSAMNGKSSRSYHEIRQQVIKDMDE